MSVKPIPDHLSNISPYLVIPDIQAEVDFMKKVFGAEVLSTIPSLKGTLAHAEVKIGNATIMMGASSDQFPPVPCMLYVYTEDTDATYKKALDAGAASLMKPGNQFYGDRNAGVQDQNGISWWIATHFEDVPHDEMVKRSQAREAERT